MVRVYFNKACSRPWSVDTGAGTTERTYQYVAFVGMTGCAVYEPCVGDDTVTPTAWIEFNDEVRVIDGCDGGLATLVPA